MTLQAPLPTQALVIGAGPVGLFQIFQLGLLGRHAEVVDALPHAGGQCAVLYPDKPIYDIPGLPACTAGELVERLLEQVRPFRPGFHWQHCISAFERSDDGRYLVTSDRGTRWLADEIFIAAGVGAFVPRKLALPGAEAIEGRHLHYHLPAHGALAGRQVVIVGDGDEALSAAIALAQADSARAGEITLNYRRETLRAQPHLVESMQALRAAGRLRFVVGPLSALHVEGEVLRGVDLFTPEGQAQRLAADTLVVLQGLSPRLGPLLEWGLNLDHKQIKVDTQRFETSLPGVYAVGDINAYAGKRKLIVCGFHEATLAAYAAAARHTPTGEVPLLYSTTSTLLHERLHAAPHDGDATA